MRQVIGWVVGPYTYLVGPTFINVFRHTMRGAHRVYVLRRKSR